MVEPFLIFQIFIPIVAVGFVAICCTSFCKIFCQGRKVRQQQPAPQTQAHDSSASVYVIPINLSDDDVHRPPHYSTAQVYDLPPAYNQVKPEVFPLEPPPSYTEAISYSPSHS